MSGALAINFTSTTLPEKSDLFQGRQPLNSGDNTVGEDEMKSLLHEIQADRINLLSENTSDFFSFTMPKSEKANSENTARRIITSAFGAPELSLQPLQEWEGYVTAISEESFSARLVDRTAGRSIEAETGIFQSPIYQMMIESYWLLAESFDG